MFFFWNNSQKFSEIRDKHIFAFDFYLQVIKLVIMSILVTSDNER